MLETVFWQKGVFEKEHKHLDWTSNGWEWKERESQVSPPVMQTVWCPLQCGVQSSYIETLGWEFLNTTLQRGKVLHRECGRVVLRKCYAEVLSQGVRSRCVQDDSSAHWITLRDYFAPAQSGDGQQESGWLGGAANVKTHPARACHAMFEPGMPRNAPCPPQLYMPPT